MDSPIHPQITEQKKEIEEKVSSSLPPPSPTASPSHEFSFTISLQPTTPPPLNSSLSITNTCTDNVSTSVRTVDLSPADEIFSGGQLLPLETVSNTNASPRNSNSSAENFSLPLDRIESDLSQRCNTSIASNKSEAMKAKLKLISDVFRVGNWRAKIDEAKRKEDNKTKMNKKRLDLGQVVKKFISMVEHIFSYNRRERERRQEMQRRPHSFSVHSIPKEGEGWRKRKGQRSAPASTRASPSHSGHFSMGSIKKLSSSSDESTMDELHNAIEAAIAHCKSSISVKGEQA